jgi:pyrimidine deaminase RibD-like protein
MRCCIELSRIAGSQGEFPFACVIAKGEDIIVETTNRVARDKDVACHAELLAVSEAQRKLGRTLSAKHQRSDLVAYRKSAFTCEWCGRPITLSDMPCSVISEAERRQRANTTSDVACQRELHESGYRDG